MLVYFVFNLVQNWPSVQKWPLVQKWQKSQKNLDKHGTLTILTCKIFKFWLDTKIYHLEYFFWFIIYFIYFKTHLKYHYSIFLIFLFTTVFYINFNFILKMAKKTCTFKNLWQPCSLRHLKNLLSKLYVSKTLTYKFFKFIFFNY